MKTIVLFALIGLAIAEDIEYYTTGDDHFDMDAFFADRTLVQSYLDCYRGSGPCSELASSYKKVLPDAIKTGCRRCNPNQKYLLNSLLQGLKAIAPEEYWDLRIRYDPEDKYFDDLEKNISKYTKPVPDRTL